MRRDPPTSRWLSAAAVGLGVLAWALVHPYQGIFHDAKLYTLQALARIDPLPLSQDVFLKFGSQDRFTVFSPMYAATIRLIGLDHAAALLTFLSQVGLLTATHCLARTVVPRWARLWALAGVMALPLYYGPDRIFAALEDFITPRMLAEALVLAALAGVLVGRQWLGMCVLMAAFAIHPVMASAGAAAIVALQLFRLPVRRALLVTALLFASILLAAYAMPLGLGGRFDAQWLRLVANRSPYLFMSGWEWDDWARAGEVVTTLILGALALTGRAQLLSRMALLSVLAGWLLTWVACDSLHLVLLTQLQPWRVQWLATVVAVMLLPVVIFTLWSSGWSGRATAMLLLSSWILAVDQFALPTCALCLIARATARLNPTAIRLTAVVACAVMASAVLWRLVSYSQFTDVHYLEPSLPAWVHWACSVAREGSWILLLLGALALLPAGLARTVSQCCLAVSAALTFLMLPYDWRAWSDTAFADLGPHYAEWRALIPPGEDVLWPESTLSAWVLLGRSSYLSGLQTSGLVYSRAAALEFARRAESLRPQLAPQTFLDWGEIGPSLSLSPAQLRGVCDSGVVEFLITSEDLGEAVLGVLAKDPAGHAPALKLYRCRAQARAAAAAT